MTTRQLVIQSKENEPPWFLDEHDAERLVELLGAIADKCGVDRQERRSFTAQQADARFTRAMLDGLFPALAEASQHGLSSFEITGSGGTQGYSVSLLEVESPGAGDGEA